MSHKRLFLIDGNSLTYRAFYALPDTMRTASGLTTNAVYGFTTMLLKLLDEQPDFVAIAFDRPEPTFRHQEYKEYKATRQKAPPTLHEQIPYVKEVARTFGLPIFEVAGFEADDIIGTLAKLAEKKGIEATIISGDLDPLQLVSDQIKVLTTRKGLTDTVLYGAKEVKERYGLEPGQLIDYKALKGDTSDNIPGVPKVGEKTAVELLQKYGSLENIYSHLNEINKPALQANLKNNLPLAELSRKLGTIVTTVPLAVDWESLKWREIDWHKARPLMEKLEFSSLAKKYAPTTQEMQPGRIIEHKRSQLNDFQFTLVQTEDELAKLLGTLHQAAAFAFDVETTSLNTYAAEIIGISFSTGPKSASYLPWPAATDQRQALQNKLQPFLVGQKLKIGHNLKYDIKVLNQAGFTVAGPIFDTMVAAYLLDPVSGKLSLKHLAKQFLDREMIHFGELVSAEADFENFSQVPAELARDYACSDAAATFALYEIFQLALRAQKLDKLFLDMEMPLLPVLVEMEEHGVAIDLPLMAALSKDLAHELKELERHIFAIAGETFNVNSPKQLANILFNKLQLPIIKKTKTGPSTDAHVLEELAGKNFEIAEKLLDYRQLIKLKNTYIDVLPALVEPKTGRIHTSYNQTITATGRLSSSEPNLQNIPIKGAWGKKLRSAFIPGEKDWLIVAADYSQIELRILAHLAKDEELIKAFREGIDVHQATADQLGISRAAAKTVNFGVIYGISDFGLAKQLKIKRTEAGEYISRYFAKYRGVKQFMDETIKQAKEQGYVTTLLGRKRPTPDINNPNQGFRQAAERMAINTPVQGTAADLIKLAMIKVHSEIRAHNFQTKLIMQVHDELVLECPKSELMAIEKLVGQIMESSISLAVPLVVDISHGANWAN